MDITNCLAWNLYVQLRQEVVSTQQLRARAIGFKITFVAGAIALIVANRPSVDDRLLVVPAFAAMFFDFVINSYNVSIKRIGAYIRLFLEPELKGMAGWTAKRMTWEDFMSQHAHRQNLAMIGNLGITVIASVPGVLVLLQTQPPTWSSILILFGLFLAFGFVMAAHLIQKKFVEMPPRDEPRPPELNPTVDR